MTKCACAMTTGELLASNVTGKRGIRAVLIEDTGKSWLVTEYSSDAAGIGQDFTTLQAAQEEAERIAGVGLQEVGTKEVSQ